MFSESLAISMGFRRQCRCVWHCWDWKSCSVQKDLLRRWQDATAQHTDTQEEPKQYNEIFRTQPREFHVNCCILKGRNGSTSDPQKLLNSLRLSTRSDCQGLGTSRFGFGQLLPTLHSSLLKSNLNLSRTGFSKFILHRVPNYF